MTQDGSNDQLHVGSSIRQLLITGGWAHEFERTTPHLVQCAAAAGIRTDTTDDLEAAAATLAAHEYDLLTVYACWFTMGHERYDAVRDQWSRRTPTALREAIVSHLEAGRGLVALHTAPICFDDWPVWGEILGGRWNWDRSWHPAPGVVEVDPRSPAAGERHPIVDGLEPFQVVDERYSALDVSSRSEVLAWSDAEREPALWTHRYGRARVVVDTLGHDERSLDQPDHATILRRSAVWAAGSSDHAVRATR
ncbi:MAG: ThuA domain-containing protein [Actinobacteria bacterium]|nr:ThuA domain-containing protein [Actinomycetota bacterium]